jgi:hypothetical protein
MRAPCKKGDQGFRVLGFAAVLSVDPRIGQQSRLTGVALKPVTLNHWVVGAIPTFQRGASPSGKRSYEAEIGTKISLIILDLPTGYPRSDLVFRAGEHYFAIKPTTAAPNVISMSP